MSFLNEERMLRWQTCTHARIDSLRRLETIMTTERFSQYQFEMSGTQLTDSGKWVPYLQIKVHSNGQENGEVIFPLQRVAEEDVFDSEEAAIDEARRFAMNHVSSGEF